MKVRGYDDLESKWRGVCQSNQLLFQLPAVYCLIIALLSLSEGRSLKPANAPNWDAPIKNDEFHRLSIFKTLKLNGTDCYAGGQCPPYDIFRFRRSKNAYFSAITLKLPMTWFIFATLTAVFESLKDVTSKHGLKTINVYIVSWSLIVFTLPLLLPLLFFINIPELGNRFGLALIVGGSFNVISMILYIKAIKVSDLSITVPLITFTPLFLLVTSPLIVQEYPTVMDAIGMVLIVAGSYILNLKEKAQGYLAPFQSLFREKGPKLMILVAFIWSITSNVDKVGVQNSSPTFWAIANYSFIATAMTPIMLYKAYNHLTQIRQNFISLIPIGLFHGAAVLFQMQAINLTLVAHVISIKRMSVLLSVLLGHFIFKEKGIKERSLGAAIMISGVVLITI